MVDLLDAPVMDSGEPEDSGSSFSLTEEDPCKCPLTHETDTQKCDQYLPEGHAPNRVKCEGCNRDTGWIHKGKAKKDTPPVNVTVKMPGTTGPKSKLDGTKAKVQGAATAWLGLVAAGVEMSGDIECSAAIKASTPQVALQLAELSAYHPIIVKVLCPVEASGEIAVWIALVLAVSPVIITVLAHHNLIPQSVAEKIGMAAQMSAVIVTAAPTPAE